MTISIDLIPEQLRADKNITPYIHRAIELEQAEPIISYYNKIYVLEYILNNKIHSRSKANEELTIKLLDDTECTKKDTADESLHKVLNDKNLSYRYVLKFAFGLFNSCLESLKSYKIENKPQLIAKFRAAMCFLNVLGTFESSSDSIDFEGIFGPKIKDWNDFKTVNKEKLKVLKYQLTKLVKDEISPIEDPESSNADLEKELDVELQKLSTGQPDQENVEVSADEEVRDVPEDDVNENNVSGSNFGGVSDNFPAIDKFIEAGGSNEVQTDHDLNEYNTDDSGTEAVNLPGAPHFIPDEGSDSDSVRLPQAPKYLPTDDIGHINKSGSIQVFPPKSEERGISYTLSDTKPASVKPVRPHNHEKPLSKENIKEILNRDDAVVQIHKHTKFANSALQFEDFNEAENQLLKGLELLRALKRQKE